MTKKQKFIETINEAYFSKVDLETIDPDVILYWKALTDTTENEKPIITDNGKLILKYLQDNPDREMMKARDIAEGLVVNSRMVSGSIRKLVTDGFVEKVGKEPVVYALTDKGKNFKIED